MIFLIDVPQALHQQIFVIQDLIAAVTDDDGGIAAGGHDGRSLSLGQKLADAVNDTVQHAGGAVDDAGAHAVLGVFADEALGMLERDIRQLGRDKIVLITTHITGDVESIASEILLLHHGVLLADAPAEEFIRGCGAANLEDAYYLIGNYQEKQFQFIAQREDIIDKYEDKLGLSLIHISEPTRP